MNISLQCLQNQNFHFFLQSLSNIYSSDIKQVTNSSISQYYKQKSNISSLFLEIDQMLWQPLITKTNDHTSGKFLRLDIKWEVHKRTQQGVSAKLESYIYKVHMVRTTILCSPHFLLKVTMLYICALTLSSRSFYHVLGL